MKGPPPPEVEVRRRKLMKHDRQLYDYVEALVAARELERVGGDASGALDQYGAANRVWAAAGRWRQRRDALRAAEGQFPGPEPCAGSSQATKIGHTGPSSGGGPRAEGSPHA